MKNGKYFKRVFTGILASVMTATMAVGFTGCKKTVRGSTTSEGTEGSEYVVGWDESGTQGTDGTEGTEGTDGTDGTDSVLNSSSTTGSGTSTNTNSGTHTIESPNLTPEANFDVYAKIPKNVKQIKLLLWYTPDSSEQAVYDAFTKKFGIKVKLICTDGDNYLSKLTTLVASNDAPDVAGVGNFPAPVIKGLFQKIDVASSSKGGAFNLSKDPAYDLAAMKYASWKGAYYGVQLKGNWHADRPMTVFNRTLFNSKGVTDPYTLWKNGKWNWTTFQDCAKRMTYTKEGIKVYGCSGADTVFDRMFLSSMGTNYITYNNDSGTLTNNMSNSNVVKALTYVAELKNSGVVAPMGTDWQIFTKGQCAMWLTGCSQVKKSREFEGMSDDWSAVPIPCPEGQKVIAPYKSTTFGIPTGAKNGIAGSYLIRWFLDANNWDMRSSFHSDEIYNVWLEQQDYPIYYYNVSPIVDTVSGLSNSLTKVTWGSVNDVSTGLKGLSGNINSAINNVINEMKGY